MEEHINTEYHQHFTKYLEPFLSRFPPDVFDLCLDTSENIRFPKTKVLKFIEFFKNSKKINVSLWDEYSNSNRNFKQYKKYPNILSMNFRYSGLKSKDLIDLEGLENIEGLSLNGEYFFNNQTFSR